MTQSLLRARLRRQMGIWFRSLVACSFFASLFACSDAPAEVQGTEEATSSGGAGTNSDTAVSDVSGGVELSTDATSVGDGDGEDGDGDESSDSGPADCDDLPEPMIKVLEGAVGSAGLAFDDSGNMLGSDTLALFVSEYETTASLFVPGLGGRGHMLILPSGDLAMVTGWEEELVFVHTDGSTEPPMAWFDEPYGLALDQDGMLFVADNRRLYRIDPDDGSSETLLTSQEILWPRVVAFDENYESIFVGMQSAEDVIYRVYFDEAGELETPQAWASLGGTDSPWVDGIALDECGNVYVAEYWDRRLYRIGPEGGSAEVLVEWEEEESYGHDVVWGSGVGGWKDTALYLPRPYGGNTVAEVELGVRSIHPLVP